MSEEKNSGEMAALLRDVEGLLKDLAGTDVTEVSWENEEYQLKIRRGRIAARFQQHHPPAGGEKPAEDAEESVLVVSPVVGVFHFAEAKPQKGTTVKDGKQLGYVEAINIRHTLEIERPGVVREIHVSEGEPVEYGRILFTMEDHV